jgi:hypothetical protein
MIYDWKCQRINFKDDDFHCPTCKREFEAGDLDSKKVLMLEGFKNKIQCLSWYKYEVLI